MKSIKYIIIAAVMALACSSCLEYNLKTLDVYDGADITSAYVYYRYVDNSKTFPLSGANAVKQSTLSVKNNIDAETSRKARKARSAQVNWWSLSRSRQQLSSPPAEILPLSELLPTGPLLTPMWSRQPTGQRRSGLFLLLLTSNVYS